MKLQLVTLAAAVCLVASTASAGEKSVMHCFAFTVIEKATPAEWEAFTKSTDELPGKIKGLKKVWHGKLARPLTQYAVSFPDGEARKKFVEAKQGTLDVKMVQRQHGVCMEFADEAAFKSYGADPGHGGWAAVYEKVRVAGTTTYQILGQ